MNAFNLRSVYFEIGSLCNLRCIHCYNNSGKPTYSFDDKQINKIFDEISKIGCNKVIISGGEPLLHNDVIDLLNFGKSTFGFEIGLITNGTLIDNNFAKKLSRAVDYVQVSIDGTSPEENDVVRGSGTFQKAMKATKLLGENDIKVTVNFVVTGNNTHNLYTFLSDLKRNNVSAVTFKEVINVGRVKEGISTASNLIKDMVDELLPVMEELQDENFNITPPYVSNSKCPLYFKEGYAPDIEIRISFTGEVFLCQKFETEKIFSLGNIRDDSLINILQSQRYRDLFNLIDVSTKFIKKCEGCFFTDMCFRECPATIISHGIFDYEDPLCELRQFGTY